MRKIDWNSPITKKENVMWKIMTYLPVYLVYIIGMVYIFRNNIKTWIGNKIKMIKGKFFNKK